MKFLLIHFSQLILACINSEKGDNHIYPLVRKFLMITVLSRILFTGSIERMDQLDPIRKRRKSLKKIINSILMRSLCSFVGSSFIGKFRLKNGIMTFQQNSINYISPLYVPCLYPLTIQCLRFVFLYVLNLPYDIVPFLQQCGPIF